jgi:O-antigen ligase
MRKRRRSEETEAAEFFEAASGKPSILNSAIFALLFTMMIFSAIAYGAVDPWTLGINCVLAGLILILWLADSIFTKRLRFSTNVLQLPLLGLIFIGLIQLLPLRTSGLPSDLLSVPATATLSLSPFPTQMFVVQLCVYLIFFAAALTFLDSEKRVQKAVFIIITFSSLMAFFGIIQSLSGTDWIYGIRQVTYSVPFASFINRHHFAAFMEMTIGLTLSLLYGGSTKKDKKLLLIIAVILMGIAVILTGSRGGILSLLGVVAFVTILNLTNKPQKNNDFETDSSFAKSYANLILIGSSFALLLALLGSVLFLGGDGALMRGVGMTEQADFSTGRTHFWKTTLQIIADNPIIGTGLDSFGMPFTKYNTWNGNMRVVQAHNDYLQILSDAGILGFACAAAFIFLLFKKGLKLVKETNDLFGRGVIIGSLAGCFGILMHSFVDFPLRTSSNSLVFLMLAVLATTSIQYSRRHRR